MTPRRAVSVLLAVVAATMLVTGSFGFSSVSAERGVSINVVESENAYVGVSVCEISNGDGEDNGNGSNPVRVTVSNQFSETFDVTEITLGGSGGPDADVDRESISTGESSTFDVKAHGYDQLTVEVADGLDASVTVDVPDEQCSTNGVGVNENRGGGQNATATPTPEPTETPTPEGNETDGE